jgi:hypothetical protein
MSIGVQLVSLKGRNELEGGVVNESIILRYWVFLTD